MKYLLDTNPCIQYLNGTSETLRRRLDAAEEGSVCVCSVVKAELFYGAKKAREPSLVLELQERFLARYPSISFDDGAARCYGAIRADLERAGTPIGANDLMIAAIAAANDLTLITHNLREFVRIPDLNVEDWQSP